MKINIKFLVLIFSGIVSNSHIYSQEINSASSYIVKENIKNPPFASQDSFIVNQNSNGVSTLCSQSVIPPVVLNGINVTSTFSGDVQSYPYVWSSCSVSYTTPSNSIWLGQYTSFIYTFNFSPPVNNLVIVITGTGVTDNEVFNFTTSSGNPTITNNGSCNTSVIGSTIISGAGSDQNVGGGGGIFTITNSTSFTSMTISGPGGSNGSLFALCSNSVIPVLCNAGTLAPILSANTITNVCPNTSINLNTLTALNTPSFTGVSLSWFTSSLPSSSNQLTNSQISNMPAGATYYAAFFDSINNCYSSSTPVTTSLNPTIIPLFNQVSPICEGSSISLPIISINGISGSWSPAINNNSTTTYTFTPGNNLCANVVSMTIVVNQKATPIFTQVAPICEGSSISLPIISNDGISGSWSPSINNNSTTIYTFTPTIGLCANVVSMTIVVNQKATPIFNIITPLCYGTNFTLPTISNQGINGTWTPGVNNLNTTTYTFTPNSDQCAIPSTLIISVLKDFDFEISDNCVNGNFILTSNPIINSYSSNTAIYNWEYNNITVGSNSNFNVTNYLKSNAILVTLPITFKLIVTNSDGCSKSKEFIIDNLYCDIQKGISPDGDGYNDFFDLRLMNVKELSIYNRYGVKVFNKENYYDEWVGQTNNGQILPDGVYYYFINFKDNSDSKTGWIYINR